MRSAGGSRAALRAWRGVFEGDVEFKNAGGAPARHGRRGRRRLGRGRRRRRRRPTWDGGTRAARRARRAADVDAGAHRSSRRREVVPETPSRAAACCARSASAVSSLLEIICGVGSRLPACTRIVMRRACSCEVRWGNGLRCGARAVVGTLLRAYLLASFCRLEKSTLAKRVHLVTLLFADEFSNASRRRPGTLRERHDGYLGSLPKSSRPCLARDPSAGPLALLAGVLRGLRRGRTVLVSHFCASLRAALGEFPRAPARHDSATRRSQPPD